MPTEKQVQSTPISVDGDDDVVIEQENTGADNMRGSGEWPSPETPPEPGAVGDSAVEELRDR
jgi:hypothetical protein